MDMSLFLCLAAAFIAVEATSSDRIEPRCEKYCPNGYEPGEICQCRHPTRTPCQRKECGRRERCVERNGRAICVDKYPTFPNKPNGGSDRKNHIEPRCLKYCPNGYAPGEICQCRHPTRNSCQFKKCGKRERCVERNGRAICVVKYPTFPTKPIGGSGRKVCFLPKVTGPCYAYIRRYFYNSSTRRCERFVYGGCKGNKNNFKTLRECRRTCQRGQRRRSKQTY